MRTALILSVAFLLGSCVRTNLMRFPTFDEALALPGSKYPIVVFEEELDFSKLPLIVQFASISASSTQNSSREALTSHIVSKARELNLRPDIVVIGRTQWRTTGMIHYGYGIFANTSATSAWGWLYRVAPSCVGFHADDNKMVISIDPKGHARSAGIQEGDVITSVNGHPMNYNPKAGLSQLILSVEVGEELDVVWIRPGKGVMKGKLKTIPNTTKGLVALRKVAERREKKRREEKEAARKEEEAAREAMEMYYE